MSGPRRLLDETDDEFVVGLLRAAQKQAPRRSSVNKTLLALGTSASVLGGHAAGAAAAGAAGGTGSSALAAPLVKLAVKWTLLGGVAMGTAVTVVDLKPGADTHASETTLAPSTSVRVHETPKRRSPPARPVPSAQPESVAAVDTAVPVEQRAVPVEQPAVIGRSEIAASPRHPSVASPRHPRVAPQAREQLAQEVALLDRAARALNDHEFEQALALTDQYLTRFVSGRLEPEARYLKMQAQRGMGDRSGASDEASRLLRVSPDGPHARAAREAQRD